MLYYLEYELIEVIGAGTYGTVWIAEILTGKHQSEFVAIKIINMDDFSEIYIKKFIVYLIRNKFIFYHIFHIKML